MTETNNEVWRELIGAVMTVLERRRNRNAYFAMPIAYDADDAYRDALPAGTPASSWNGPITY